MRRNTRITIVLALILVGRASAQTNIDPNDKWAWSENCGWTNWQHGAPEQGDGVFVTQTILAGFVWAENIGWVTLGDGEPVDGLHYANETGEDFGVNVDPETGDLFGMAWGENVGWINFNGGALADPANPARLDGCRMAGFAWGENIGWVNLDDATHFVRVEVVCPADLNEDCEVGAGDLAELLAAWGLCPEPCDAGDPADTCAADLNGDCDVGPFDLATLLAAWGSCLE